MSDLISLGDVKNRFVTVRSELSLLAGDVAALYGVEPHEVAQVVKNNSAKFTHALQMDFFSNFIDRSRNTEGTTSRSERHKRPICELLSVEHQPNIVPA